MKPVKGEGSSEGDALDGDQGLKRRSGNEVKANDEVGRRRNNWNSEKLCS